MVLVGINEDPKSFEVIFVTEDCARRSAALGYPYGHAVAVEIANAVYLELDFDLGKV